MIAARLLPGCFVLEDIFDGAVALVSVPPVFFELVCDIAVCVEDLARKR